MNASSMSALERRAVAALACLYVFRMLGLFMLLPVLPLYAAEYAFSTPLLVGLALGIYGLGQAVLQIPLGMLSDRIGRKSVIVAGLLLFAAGGVLAASASSIYTVILGRLLQGTGAIASTLTAAVADLTREQHRSKAMAAIGVSIGLSFAVAMVVGPAFTSAYGISALFLLTAALALIGVGVAVFIVPSPRIQSRAPGERPLAGLLRRCLTSGSLMRLNIGVFVLHAVMMALFLVLPSRLTELGLLVERHWQVYLPVVIVAFLLMIPALVVAEKRDWQEQLLRAAIVLLASALLGAALAPSALWIAVAVLLLFFTSFNYLEAALPALLSRSVYAGGKGTAMGVFASCQFMGAFCGGALGGWLLEYGGEVAMFAVAAGAVLLWLLSARGMTLPAPSLSLTLSWRDSEWNYERLQRELLCLPGALDMTVFEVDRQVYLRAERGFDIARLPPGLSLRD